MATGKEIDEISSELESQFAATIDSIIEKRVNERLDKFIISEDNLSPEIIKMIHSMTQTAGVQNPPKPTSIPVQQEWEKDAKGEYVLEDGKRKPIIEKPIVTNKDVRKIVSDVLSGNNVYLFGRAGTGKTHLAEAVAESIFRRKSYTINCSQWTSPTQIIGGQTIQGYKEGLLIRAWREGAILILDELPKLDPNTAGLLNDALAKTSDAARPREASASRTYITDGKGDKVQCNMEGGFGVIATGNTDMKTADLKYGGNNKQDYSLVDRFAGSYFLIKADKELEKRLIYSSVWKIADLIRNFLEIDVNSIENISIRTMLNFNRTYEKEMLALLESPYADELNMPDTRLGANADPALQNVGKTLKDAIMSFVDTLASQKKTDLLATTPLLKEIEGATNDQATFIADFKKFYGISYDTPLEVVAPVEAPRKIVKQRKGN